VQVWWNISKSFSKIAHHAKQIFPANRDVFSRLFSALEATEQVRLVYTWAWGSCGGPREEKGYSVNVAGAVPHPIVNPVSYKLSQHN